MAWHAVLYSTLCLSAAESEGEISQRASKTGLHSNRAPQKSADPFGASMPIRAAKPILHKATHPLDPISAFQHLLQISHGYILMQTTLMPKRTPMPFRLKCPLHDGTMDKQPAAILPCSLWCWFKRSHGRKGVSSFSRNKALSTNQLHTTI